MGNWSACYIANEIKNDPRWQWGQLGCRSSLVPSLACERRIGLPSGTSQLSQSGKRKSHIGSFSLLHCRRQRASMRSMMRASCRRSLPMDPSLLWRTRRLMWMIHAQLRWLSSHKLFSFLSPGVCSSLRWFGCNWLAPVGWTPSHQSRRTVYRSPRSLEPWDQSCIAWTRVVLCVKL